ncbi:hypothetical protein O3W44_22055 [Pantoea sp. LMR881]|uniref:hypothetical protein n=1 Tax=Pantoea sp. LMR881 TaxID=3014336 RepID=UPI0022AF93B0|nr:hypothetical protein [Pantoea sp. LMR881]MCZ4061216.1 hypothetical protein [Pantoea sp. LMR881]
MHHLTLPWTPASIAQRNGRGARVGSKASKVRVRYYCGKGSFDDFRMKALKSKANWIGDILTSDASRMANADANSQEEMNLLLAADPEDYARRVEEAKKKAEAIARAAAEKRAKIDLNELVKMQHALKLPVNLVESTLTNARTTLDSRRQYIASKQEELQEAIDKGQSYLEKSLRFEIVELSKEINKAQTNIRRGERQLVRAKKAEQRIKQLRPEVERAINAGLVDVDIDILTHGDKYVLLPDGRTVKIGAIYSRYSGDSYIRVMSLDIDASEAVCDEIFKSRIADKLHKKIRVRFDNLGELSDMPESEASLREWGAQGQHIYQVADRVTKAEFVSLLKASQLLLTDDYVVYRDAEGKLADYALRESKTYGYGTIIKSGSLSWLAQNADKIVYPDTNDVELKTATAGWYRGDRSTRHVEPFMIALFGRDFQKEVDNYGETANAVVIASVVSDYIAKQLEGTDREGRNFKGEGKSQYGAYLLQGQYDPAKYMEWHISVRNTAYVPEQYKNKDDFTATLQETFALKTREHLAATISTAKERAHKVWLNYRDQLKASLEDIIELLKRVPENASQMAYMYRTYSSNHLDYETNNYDVLFAHAVRLGLVVENSITEGCFADSVMLNETVSRINAAFAEANKDREGLINNLKLKAGLISKDEIDAAKANKAARDAEAKEEAESAMRDSITIKRNSQALTGGKAANRYNFAPDEAICLQDEEGKDGALYRAKDTLKAKFRAKYHNGKITGQELMGSWWIISAQHSMQDVLAVISSYK